MSQLYVDNIRNRTGGPIGIPTGAVVTGVITATTANVTGNMTVGGVLTYEDVTNVDSVGLITARSGIDVTSSGVYVSSGIVTATDFNSTSDETLKENITTVENAVDLNNQLRGVRFEWKKDGKPSYFDVSKNNSLIFFQ